MSIIFFVSALDTIITPLSLRSHASCSTSTQHLRSANLALTPVRTHTISKAREWREEIDDKVSVRRHARHSSERALRTPHAAPTPDGTPDYVTCLSNPHVVYEPCHGRVLACYN